MARVSQETISKLNDFIDSLPEEARNKCALCNETLTHIVKQAEAQTGAGTATVTRELTNRINEKAAPGDRVTPKALNERVRWNEGLKSQNEKIKPIEGKGFPSCYYDSPEWPICKSCNEKKTTGRWKKNRGRDPDLIPNEDGLCMKCRHKQFNDKIAAFEARPIDGESERFWNEVADMLELKFGGDSVPKGKISKETLNRVRAIDWKMSEFLNCVVGETSFST